MTLDMFLPFARAILAGAIVFLILVLSWLVIADDPPAENVEDR